MKAIRWDSEVSRFVALALPKAPAAARDTDVGGGGVRPGEGEEFAVFRLDGCHPAVSEGQVPEPGRHQSRTPDRQWRRTGVGVLPVNDLGKLVLVPPWSPSLLRLLRLRA